jgi:hypothetical protein
MLVGCVIENQLGDHAQPAPVRFTQKDLEFAQRAVRRMNIGVIRRVETVVPPGRRIERQQSSRGDAEILDVIQFSRQARKVAFAVSVAVGKGPDVTS